MKDIRYSGLRIFALLVLVHLPASAAVFQYSVPVVTDKSPSRAFLWMPPESKSIRGVVMAGMTLMEREFAQDRVIRETCARNDLAIVFLKCGLMAADPQKVLDDLAGVSGYEELSRAPMLFVGHSAGGPQALKRAREYASRCFGLVQYRGGGPFNDDSLPAGIPALMMIGQFDEFAGKLREESGRESWQRSCEMLAEFRAKEPGQLASIVVEPGAGHFAWSDRNAPYLAMFISKAAAARLPVKRGDELRRIEPRSGWLSDLSITGKVPPGSFDSYKGEASNTAWHFDREMAEATVAYHKGLLGKKDQFIRWNDPTWVDAGARFFFTNLKWLAADAFEVHPVYADQYPTLQANNQGPRWADAGKPVGHSTAPIRLKQVSGPLVVVGENRLRIEFNTLAPATEAARPTFMAYSVGDDQFRYTEQVGMMPRGFNGLKDGAAQSITFAPIAPLKAGGSPVEMQASSDRNLPVQFHVAYGPARVQGNKLIACELPARAKYPIELKVVAWQFGSAVEPKVRTATPVERTAKIEAP